MQTRVFDRAGIAVGCKPFFDGEAVAVAVQHHEPAVAAAYGGGLAVTGHQHIG